MVYPPFFMKHIISPWIVVKDDEFFIVYEDNGNGEEVCSIRYSNTSLFRAEDITNLIKSAPDLLIAAKRALESFKNQPPHYNEDIYEPILLLNRAIKKAEGSI